MKWAVVCGMLGCLVLGLGIPVYYLVELHGLGGTLAWLFQLGWLGLAYIGATCLLGGTAGLIAGGVISIILRCIGGKEGVWSRVACVTFGFVGGGTAGFFLGAFAATVVLFSQLENVPLW